jgi:anti-anti-sigma factor
MELETLRSIAMSQPEGVLEIDLAGIETVDASGLGLLVELQHWALTRGRTLRFTNASEFVSRMVALTRLYNVLAIAPGAGDAVRQPNVPALTA